MAGGDEQQKQQFIDPISLRLNNINENEAKEMGFTVVPMTLEESFQVNRRAIGNMSPMQYQKLYRESMEEDMYDAAWNRRLDQNRDATYDFMQSTVRPGEQKPGLPIQAHPKAWGISAENAWKYQSEDSNKRLSQIGYEYGLNGTRRQTLNNEQIAESRKQYWDPKANLGMGAFKSIETYQRSNHFGSPYRFDDDGTKKMLVMDNANKMWVEVDEDDVIAGNQLRSTWGTKEKDSGFFQHVSDSFYNGVVDLSSNMWGSMVESMGTMGKFMSGSDDVNSWQKWGRSVQNYGNANKSKISEAAENEGMFGSWRAGFGTVTNMLPQLAVQAGIGYLTGGASAYVQALGKGGQFAARMMSGAPYMFGAIYAANGMNEEGKAAGLSDNDRMFMNLLAGGAVFAAEKFTSKFLGATGIADGFANKASREIVEKNMAKGYSEVTKKFTPTIISKTASNAEKEAAKEAASSTLGRYYLNGLKAVVTTGNLGKNLGQNLLNGTQRLLSAPIRFGYTTTPKTLMGRTRGFVASAWEEGWEEEIEKHMNYWFKEAYNAGMIGIDGPDKYAAPGKGMFDNTVHSKPYDEFFAGAIGGGIMGAIFGGRMKRNFSDKVAIEYALQFGGDADKADAGLLNMKERIGLDSKITDPNDNFLSMFSETERKDVKSRNDIAFEALREDVRAACQIIKTFKLTDADKIARIAGGDMRLVNDTVENLVNARKLSTEIEGLKKQLQDTKPEDVNYKELERQIQEKEVDLKQVSKLADDVLSGKAIENYRAQTFVRGLLVNNEYNNLYNSIESETDPEVKRQKAQKAFDDSIDNAEKRDLWKDQEKALNLIYNSREILEQFKQSKATIEERTKQSNDFVSEFDSIDFNNPDSINEVLQKVNGNHLEEIVGKKIDDISKKINDEREKIQNELDTDFNSVRDKFGFDDVTFDDLYNKTGNDEIDAAIDEVLGKKKDKVERFSALNGVDNEIKNAKTLLKNRGAVKYVPGGGIDTRTGEWNNGDYFTQQANQRKYKKVNKDVETEIDEKTFLSMQDAAKAQGKDSFEYNGEMFIADDSNQIKVDGKKAVDRSTLVDDSQLFDFLEIDDVNELFLKMPTVGGMNIREELNKISKEYDETKVLTAQMKERLKEINKNITDQEEMLSVYKWAKMLSENKILSPIQEEYMDMQTFNEINLPAYINKLAVDRSYFMNVAISTLSKDDRDNKLNELKDNVIKMQAHVYNELVAELNGDDIVVNGQTVKFPSEISLDSSETEVMQAYQWMHYFIQNLTPDQKNEFKETFDKFWSTKVESKDSIPSAKEQGMFLEGFDLMFDFEAFKDGYTKSKYHNKNNSYRELFYYHAINMMMNVDPMIAFGAISNVIDAVDASQKFELDKSKYPAGDHTAEQIMNVMIGITHLSENIKRNEANPDVAFIELLDHVKSTMKIGTSREGRFNKAKGLYDRVKDAATGKYNTNGKHIKDNVMSFFGYGGVGKSTFIIKTLSEIALSLGKKNFVFIAPNIEQKNILENTVKNIFPKGIHAEFYLVSDFVKKQDQYKDYVIFADEISLYSDEEKNSIAFNYNKIGGKKISTVDNVGFIDESNTVFLLGDTLQAPPSGEIYDNSPRIEQFTQHGFNITSVKRSSFIEIYKIQTEFRRNAKNNELGPPQLFGYSYSEDDNVKKGVKLNNDKDGFLAESKAAVESGIGYIIVHSEKEYNEIINDISPDKHDRVFLMTQLSKSPQGRTLDGEVYVYMPYSTTDTKSQYNNNKLYNMYMLTAVSRASQFVSVYTGDGLGNKNSVKVSEDKIESFDDSAEAKVERKQQLWNRISGVVKGLTAVKPVPLPVRNTNKPKAPVVQTDDLNQEEEKPEENAASNNTKGKGVKSNSKKPKKTTQVKTNNRKRKTTNKNKKQYEEQQEALEEEINEPITAYEQNVSNQGDMSEDELDNLDGNQDTDTDHSNIESSIDNGEFGLTLKTGENNVNLVTTFVNGNPFVVVVGGTYRKPDGEIIKVTRIISNDDGTYSVKTDKLKMVIPLEKFSELALSPSIDILDKYENALISFTQSGILTLFGKTIGYTPAMGPLTNKKALAAKYQEMANATAMLYKNLGQRFEVKIEIVKNMPTVDWNGSVNTAFPYVLQVSIDNGNGFEYFTTHYLQDPQRINKTVADNAQQENLEVYNNTLFGIVEKLYNANRTEFYTSATKNNISASSFIGFHKDIPVMSYSQVKDMVGMYGMELTETFQGIDKKGLAETYAIAHFGNKDNGQKIIFQSITASNMNDEQKNLMLNEVNRMRGILQNAVNQKLPNEAVNKQALQGTDSIFAFNNSFALLNNAVIAQKLYTEKDAENKTTIEERIKIRLEVLNDLAAFLSPVKDADYKYKYESLVSQFRLNTKMQGGKEVTGIEYMSTVKGLFLRMPVIDISAGILLDDTKGLASKITNQQELENYTSSFAEIQSELEDILGEGIQLGIIKSDLYHGFVDKLGKIHMNMHNGAFNPKTLSHEISHYVSEFLLTDEKQAELFDEVDKKYGVTQKQGNWRNDLDARRTVAEHLADDGERYKSDRRNLKGISKVMRSFFDWFNRFMSRIGIINDKINDFYYDLYVAKKYKSLSGMALNTVRDEMPYDSLYSRIIYDDSSFNTVANNFFYDNQIARQVANNVAEIAAKEVIMPSMNRRMFLDGAMSFTDMINRIENNSREKVMYDTDENGNTIYKEQVINGKSMFLPVIRELTVDYTKPFLRWNYNATDENGNSVTGLHLQYYDESIKGYKTAVPNSQGIFFTEKRQREEFRRLLQKSVDEFEIETVNGLVSVVDKTIEGKMKLKGIISNKDKVLYKNAMLLNSKVFKAMINRIFPSLDVDTIINRDGQVRYSDILESLIRVQDANIRKNEEELNPMDKQSDIMKLMLNTIPVYQFLPDGSVVEMRGKKLNYEVANKILTDIHSNLWIGNSQDGIEAFAKSMKRFIENKMMNNTNPTELNSDAKFISAYSIYKTYFDPQAKQSTDKYYYPSHTRIYNWNKQLSTKTRGTKDYQDALDRFYAEYLTAVNTEKESDETIRKQTPLTKDEFELNIAKRSKLSETILNSVITHFGSLTSNKFENVKKYGKGKRTTFVSMAKQSSSAHDTKLKLEQSIISNLQINGGLMPDRYVDLFINRKRPLKVKEGQEKSNSYFTMTDRGIRYRHKTNDPSDLGVIIMPLENGKFRNMKPDEINKLTQYAKNAQTNISGIIRKVFTDFFNMSKSSTAKNAAKVLSVPKVGSNTHGIENLSDVLAPLIASMYVYTVERTVDPNQITAKQPVYPLYLQALANTAKDSGQKENYGKITDATIDSILDKDAGSNILKDGEEYFFPTGFYKELQALAEIMTYNENNPTILSLDGRRKLYTIGNSHNFNYKFSNGKNDSLVEKFEEVVKGPHTNPNARGSKILNPILERKGIITSTPYMMGIDSTGKTAELKNMTVQDNLHAALANFTKNENQKALTYNISPVLIPVNNGGNRGRQHLFEVRLGHFNGNGNGFLTKQTIDNVDTFKLDVRNIASQLKRGFAIKEEAQVNSINRWMNFLMNPANNKITNNASSYFASLGLGLSPIDTTIPGWKAQRDATVPALVEYLKNYDAWIIDDDVVGFEGSGLRLGSDFLIIKANKNDKGGRLHLGHDASMMNKVLTRNEDGSLKFRSLAQQLFNYSNYNNTVTIDVDENNQIKFKLHEVLRTDDFNNEQIYVNYIDNLGLTQTYMFTDDNLQFIIDSLFEKHYKETNEIALADGYKMTSENVFDLYPYEDNIKVVDGINIYGTTPSVVWKGLIIGHAMVNYFSDHAIEGTEANHLSSVIYENETGPLTYGVNRNKRALSHTSTGFTPSFKTHNGMDEESRIMVIKDLKVNASISTLLGEINKEHIVFDGQSFNNPFSMEMYFNSIGGNNGSLNRRIQKSIAQQFNYKDGSTFLKKHAGFIVSKSMMDSSVDMANLFEYMLNPALRLVIKGEDLNKISFLKKSDIDNLANDSLYQRYLIYFDQSATETALKQTLSNINSKFGSLKTMLEGSIKYKNNAPAVDSILADWKNSQFNDTIVGQYDFISKVLADINNQGLLSQEGDKDHGRAIEMLVDFYAEYRAKNPDTYKTKYPYLSSIQFTGNKKDQTKDFEMPFVAFNKSAGATHSDANGQFNQGRPMPMFVKDGDAAPTNFYELVDYWKNQKEDAPYDKWTYMFDNTQEITQLNPEREIDDNEESPMVQAMSIILANPNSLNTGLAQEIATDLSSLMRVGLENVMRFITNEGKWSEDVDQRIKDLKIQTSDIISETGVVLSNKEIATIENFVKSKIKKSMSQSDDTTMLSEIISDDQISLNVSHGAVTRAQQYVAAFLRKEAVKRKVDAMRLVQAGGNFIDIVEHKETGEVFMLAEAYKHAAKMGVSFDSLFDVNSVRGLKHTTIDAKPDLSVEQLAQVRAIDTIMNQAIAENPANEKQIKKDFSRIKMKYLAEQNLLNVSKGEAIVPAVMFKKFNIPSNVGLNEIFRLYGKKDGIVNETNLIEASSDYNATKELIQSFVNDNISFEMKYNSNGKPRVEVLYNENQSGLNTYFEIMFVDGLNKYLKDNYKKFGSIYAKVDKEMELKYGDSYRAMKEGSLEKSVEDIKQELRTRLAEESTAFAQSEIANLVDKYTDAITSVAITLKDNIGMRIPSGPGSGFINNIVGFINDASSVGYVNTIKNLIDGSDQDVDQFTIYYLSSTMLDSGKMSILEYNNWKDKQKKDGNYNVLSDEEAKVINNKLIRHLQRYYSDPLNAELTMAAIDLDPVKKAADGTYRELFKDGDLAHNIGHSFVYRNIAMDGQAVGPFANAQKLQTLLYSGYSMNQRRGIDSSIYNFKINKVENAIGQLEDEYSKVPVYMEMLINAATDNPKLLILGAMNITMNNSDMASAMMFAPKDIQDYMRSMPGNENMNEVDAVLNFLKLDANKDIFNYVKSNSGMYNGGFSRSYYNTAYNYYKKLQAHGSEYEEQYKNNLNKNSDIFDSMVSFLINDVGYDEAFINTAIATAQTENKGDVLLSMIRNININNISKEISKKHNILKNVLDNFIKDNLEEITDNEFKAEIEKALNSKDVQASYDIVNSIASMSPIDNLANINEESKALSEKYKKFFKDLKSYKDNLKKNKNLSRKTDPSYINEVYLVTKYAMLGDIMSDLVKVANINQFKQSKAYDQKKFENDFTFATGYTIDELIGIYDRFNSWKKDNGASSTIGDYFDANPNEKKPIEAVRETAFKTKAHTMSQVDFSYMKDSIESPVTGEVINYYEDYHKIFDFASILLSRPDVMESFRASQMFKDINSSIFNIESTEIQSMIDTITDNIAYDILPEAKSIVLKEEISKYFVHLYLSEINNNGFESIVKEDIFKALEKFNILTLPMTAGSSTSNGMMHNIGNPIGVRNFISNFPEFFDTRIRQSEMQRLKEMSSKFTAQDLESAYEFIDRIEKYSYNRMDYLEVQKSRVQNANENEMLRDGFNKLSNETQTLLALYHILKNQFDTSRSFFGEVLPKKFLIDYSKFLKEVLPTKEISQDLNNISEMILSNTSLDLLKNEKRIYKDGKEFSQAPAAWYGVAKHYKKTIQTQKSKVGTTIRTFALGTTNGINGVALTQGSATKTSLSNVVPFDSVINMYNDTDAMGNPITISLSYTPTILRNLNIPMSFSLDLRPHAYIKNILHGHLENDIQNAIKRQTQEGVELTPQDVLQIVNDVMSRDLNNVYNKKGIPALQDKTTSMDMENMIRNNVFNITVNSILQKHGPNADAMLQSLDGKMLKDEYYYSDIAPSYTLHAALNMLKAEGKPFTIENLRAIESIPSIELFSDTYGVQSNEDAPLVNLLGTFGNYFTRENARDSGYVVAVNMKGPNGVGTKELFYEAAKEIFQDTSLKNDQLNTLLANILIADSIGMSTADMKNRINSLSTVSTSNIDLLKEVAFKTYYKHVDRNIDEDISKRHSTKYHNINKSIAEGKITELFGSIKSTVETLQRYQETPYEVGDMIHFPDGIVGIVTNVTSENNVNYVINHKLTDNRNIFNAQRAVVSLENIMQKNNTRFALDGFVRTIAGIMPNVEYRYVNDEEARQIQRSEHDSVSFYQDGIVYINVDKADRGVAIHEFAHPLTLAMQIEKPELFNAIAQQVSQSSVMDYVRKMYKDDLDTEEAMILEAIPTYIQFRYYARLAHEMSPEERANWEMFFAEAGSIFKEALIGDVNAESSIDNVDFKTADLNSISDAILNDMLKGKEFVVRNKEAFNIARFLPYTMRASSASSVKNINLTNIDTLFQRKSHNTKDDKARRQIMDSIQGNTFSGLSGTYDLTMRNKDFYDPNGNYDQKRKEKFIVKIVENEMAFYGGIENNIIQFLNELKVLEPLAAAKQSLFASWNKRYDLPNATEVQKEQLTQNIQKMMNKLGYNPNLDQAMMLSEAEKTLGLKLPNGVKLDNTIVIVHNIGKPAQEISILNVSPEYLSNHGMEKNNIAAAFIGENLTNKEKKRAKKLQNVTLSNDNGHIEAVKTAVIAMAIKKSSPGTVIRKVGAMHVNGSNISVRSRDVDDTVRQIELLVDNVPQLRDNLEVDIRDIVSDKTLYNMNLYKVPVGTRLLNYFRTLISTLKPNDNYKKSVQNTIDQGIKVFENGDNSFYQDIQKAVFGRIMHLAEELDSDVAKAANEEYQFLLQTYRELTGYNEINTQRFNELSFDEKLIQTADRWTGGIRTWLFDQVDLASRKGVNEMVPFNKELNKRTKTLNTLSGNILSYGLDKSHDLFKPLFKKATGYDQNGKEVQISTHEIHCDINDAETARALANREITTEQLEFGKWLADSMYEEFVQYVMTVERKNISQRANMTEVELRAAAENEVARRYKRGMMPVFVRSTGSALSEGKLMEALNMYMKNAGRFIGGALYEEFTQTEDADYQKESFRKLMSPFWNQFQNAELYGGSFRMKLLGLDLKVRNQDRSLEVIAPELQNSLSYNLQNIGNYTMMASKRTKYMQRAVASANIAMDMLRGEEAMRGINTKDAREHVENYINRQIYGNLPEMPKVMLGNISVNIDYMLDASNRFINMAHLAVKPGVAMKNVVATTSKLLINALINQISGKNFNIANVTRAVEQMFSNGEKIRALNEKYQFVNMSEKDLINHFQHVVSKANATEPDAQMILNWFGDYYNQLIGGIAQMINDGTYDAHDEFGNYDETKDKRFEGEDGEYIKNAIIEQQYKEGYHILDNGKMTHAYTQRQENHVKLQVQRFVGELTDPKYKNLASSYSFVRAASSMRSYMYNVAQAWWKNPSQTVHLGGFKVIEVDGKKETVWAPELTEGMINTLIYCAKGLRNAVKTGTFDDYKNMSSFQKRNLIAMATFTGIMAGVYLLADSMLYDEDRKKVKKYRYEKDPKTGKRKRVDIDEPWISERLLSMLYDTKYDMPIKGDLSMTEMFAKNILLKGVEEQLSYVSPYRMFQDIGSMPSTHIMQADNVAQTFVSTLMLPWTLYQQKDIEGLTNELDEYFYDLSKNMPLGGGYRDIHDTYDYMLNYIGESTKK